MYYNPFHPHCGPFNSVSRKRSRDTVDEICREHDIKYGEMGSFAYIQYNDADRVFRRKMEKIPGILPRIYENVFRVKELVAPFVQVGGPNTPSKPPRRPAVLPPTPPQIAPVASSSSSSQNNMAGKTDNVKLINSLIKKASKARKAAKRGKRSNKRTNKRNGKKRGIAKRYGKKRIKRSNKKKAYVYPITNVYENGGTVTDPQTVFAGHGTDPTNIGIALTQAIVHKLFRLHGHQITNMEDPIYGQGPIGENYVMKFRYRSSATVTAGESSSAGISPDGTTTYNEYAALLFTAMATVVNATPLTPVIFTTIFIQNTDGVGTELSVPAKMQFADMKIHVKVFSNMTLQNQTLANDGTNGDDETNISNNPVKGMRYVNAKMNGFVPRVRTDVVEANYQSYIANTSSGCIKAVNKFTDNALTTKVPPASFFRAKGQPVVMPPGMTYRDQFTYVKSMTWTRFWLSHETAFSGGKRLTSGMAHMFGLEKVIDTRTNESDINIGFQIEQAYSIGISFKKTAKPVVQYTVVTTPV